MLYTGKQNKILDLNGTDKLHMYIIRIHWNKGMYLDKHKPLSTAIVICSYEISGKYVELLQSELCNNKFQWVLMLLDYNSFMFLINPINVFKVWFNKL